MSAASEKLTAPFPWFGGKRRVADLVWSRFGDTQNYVEPFAGSLAVLLGRPHDPHIETVNDRDCFICNFWRAIAAEPDEVARWCDWPVNEADLHARHRWLHAQKDFVERMDNEPDFCDAKIAGWWVWGLSAWIGDNWCRVTKQSGMPDLLHGGRGLNAGWLWNSRPALKPNGVHRATIAQQMPEVSGHSRGVHSAGLSKKIPNKSGKGIHRGELSSKRPVLDDRGVHCHREGLYQYIRRLSERLRNVRVCCGDWARVLGPTPTFHCGMTAVFLDPPYASDRDEIYNHDSFTIANDVRKWCKTVDAHPKMRIALCGYEGEHNELEARGWSKVAWKAHGGYGNRTGNDNKNLERIWFSPHCLRVETSENGRLFE